MDMNQSIEEENREREELLVIGKKLESALEEAASYALRKSGGSNKKARAYLRCQQHSAHELYDLSRLTIEYLRNKALEV
ncbi:Uncharacterised protein [Enterococcus casseliflavus]|nr:Uncharacterised protein [Enterococcus casseliflavus]